MIKQCFTIISIKRLGFRLELYMFKKGVMAFFCDFLEFLLVKSSKIFIAQRIHEKFTVSLLFIHFPSSTRRYLSHPQLVCNDKTVGSHHK